MAAVTCHSLGGQEPHARHITAGQLESEQQEDATVVSCVGVVCMMQTAAERQCMLFSMPPFTACRNATLTAV